MGFPSPDHLLATISRGQLMGWLEWAKIRGPVGGPRRDWYHANLALYAGKPWPEEISSDELLPYWAKREAEIAKEIAAEQEQGEE